MADGNFALRVLAIAERSVPGDGGGTSIGSAAIAHVALALSALDRDCNSTNQYLTMMLRRIRSPSPGLGIAVNEEKLARYRRG